MKGNVPKTKYKLVLLGDQHVGKTALINRLINNSYDQSYNATIGIDFLVKNISYGDKHYRLQLWDTAGQQRFKSLIPSYLKDSSCCLILYDVTSVQSLENAFKWLELYNQHKNSKAISFLIGNKIDLPERQNPGPLLQEKHYMVSAKEGTGVSETFQNDHQNALARKCSPQRKDKQQQQIHTAQTLHKQTTSNTFQLKQVVQQTFVNKRDCCL